MTVGLGTIKRPATGSKFLGLYASLAELQTEHPTAEAGNYADVDAGSESDVQRYIWDLSDSKWVLQEGNGGSGTPGNAILSSGNTTLGGNVNILGEFVRSLGLGTSESPLQDLVINLIGKFRIENDSRDDYFEFDYGTGIIEFLVGQFIGKDVFGNNIIQINPNLFKVQVTGQHELDNTQGNFKFGGGEASYTDKALGEGLLLKGFGETNANGDGADYSTIPGIGLVNRKFVEDFVNPIIIAIQNNNIDYPNLQAIANFISTIDEDGEILAYIDQAVGNTTWRQPVVLSPNLGQSQTEGITQKGITDEFNSRTDLSNQQLAEIGYMRLELPPEFNLQVHPFGFNHLGNTDPGRHYISITWKESGQDEAYLVIGDDRFLINETGQANYAHTESNTKDPVRYFTLVKVGGNASSVGFGLAVNTGFVPNALDLNIEDPSRASIPFLVWNRATRKFTSPFPQLQKEIDKAYYLLTYASSVALNLNVAYESIELTGDINFASTINRGRGTRKSKTLLIKADETERTLAFNADWGWLGTKPTSLAANGKAYLILESWGPDETEVIAAYEVIGNGS
ncbi:MAG: hypothetical protein AAF363_15735 [Bacteroidota bacterium]